MCPSLFFRASSSLFFPASARVFLSLLPWLLLLSLLPWLLPGPPSLSLACAAVARVRDGQAAADVGEDCAHERLLVGVLQDQLRDCGARRVHAVLGEAGEDVLERGHG